METMTCEAHLSAPVEIDLCAGCQAFWFDKYESLKLAPGSTLRLMKFIGEHTAPARELHAQALRCPRCTGHLKATNDMQRSTKFNYWRCPQEHGRFIRFLEFLKEKDFIRPLSPKQIEELRQKIQTVNCSNCGAPIDLAAASACTHCGSPLSMLDMKQSHEMLLQLEQAAAPKPIDPDVILKLACAKLEVEASIGRLDSGPAWWSDASSSGLVQAGLSALARWLSETGI
jgi:hypothetical protein